MLQSSDRNTALIRRYALCVGIGSYTNLTNRNLRFAVSDATTIAERLADPQRGNFAVRVLTEPNQTTKTALDKAIEQLLSAPDRQAEDLTLLYFSCHGDVNPVDNTFCLWPSNATQPANGAIEQETVIGISDLARWFSRARTRNIVLLLDVCHSGGAGIALQHFKLNLDAGPNFFVVGAARQDQVTYQSSQLKHGLFTYCLLRAFEQPPTKDGWLTISQIQNFVSDEIQWFAKDHPIQIQGSSIFVNPQLPLLRSPGYPELCPLPPLWNVPFQRNLFFTEQDDVLSQLASKLQGEQKIALTQPYALSGLGGIGKTQLALEYAYRHRQDYHAVLWGSAETRETLISTFVSIAYRLDLPEKDEKDQTVIVAAVKAWLMDRSRWLFILDDANDLALIKEFIPPAFRGHLLLTTRDQSMGGLAHKLEVKEMRPEVGALLLLRRSGRLAPKAPLEHASPMEIQQAKELAQELGGLPLALDQAGAYIEETRCSFSSYLRLYRSQRKAMLQRRGGKQNDHPESAATTCSLSFAAVERRNKAAAELLRACAFFAPDAIPEEIFQVQTLETVVKDMVQQIPEEIRKRGQDTTTVEMMLRFDAGVRRRGAAGLLGFKLIRLAVNERSWNEALEIASSYSLLLRNPTEHTLSMHRIIQAVIQDALPKRKQEKWARRVITALFGFFPGREPAGMIPSQDPIVWSQCERLLPHVRFYMQEHLTLLDEYTYENLARLLSKAAIYLSARARYQEAESLFQRVLAIYEQSSTLRNYRITTSLVNLANLYMEQGKFAKAQPLIERIFSKLLFLELEAALSADVLEMTVRFFSNLAFFSMGQDKFKEAEGFFQRALHVEEKLLMQGQSAAADPAERQRNFIERVAHRLVSEWPQIERFMMMRDQEEKCSQMAVLFMHLAKLYNMKERYPEAEQLLQHALSLLEPLMGLRHPRITQLLTLLGEVYLKQGKFEEAERFYQDIIPTLEQDLGPEHPQLAGLRIGFYLKQGKYAEAEQCLQHALLVSEQVFGPEHPELADSFLSLAGMYIEQEKYAEAERCIQRTLFLLEQALGPEHPRLISPLNGLASMYIEQEKYAEAESLLTRSLTICEQALGPQHPDVATSLIELAKLYQAQGRYVEAEQLYERAITICDQALGPVHARTIKTVNDLAAIYRRQGKFAEAVLLYQRVLDTRERYLGPTHPDTAKSLVLLAAHYSTQGNFENVESLYRRALSIQEQQLGPTHPDTVQTLSLLGEFYRHQERWMEAEPLAERVLTIQEQQLGPDHPNLTGCLIDLAQIYREQGKLSKAEPLYRRVLALQEQQLGPDHPDLTECLVDLAAIYNDQVKLAEAEQMYRRALVIQEQHLGPMHPDIAIILAHLAVVYLKQAKLVEADDYLKQTKLAEVEQLFQRDLVIQEQQFGTDNLRIAPLLDLIAMIYREQGRLSEAEQLYQRALAILEQRLGSNHPDLTKYLINLAQTYRDQGKLVEAEQLEQRAHAIQEPAHPNMSSDLDNRADLSNEQNQYAENPTVPLSLVSSEIPRLLPCGHEQRFNARFCSICGAAISS